MCAPGAGPQQDLSPGADPREAWRGLCACEQSRRAHAALSTTADTPKLPAPLVESAVHLCRVHNDEDEPEGDERRRRELVGQAVPAELCAEEFPAQEEHQEGAEGARAEDDE